MSTLQKGKLVSLIVDLTTLTDLSLKKIHEILLTAGKKNTKPRTQNSVEGAPMSSSSTTSVPEINNSFTHLLANTTVEQSFDESDEEALSDVDTDATSECSHSPFAGQTCICEDDGDNTDFLDTEGEIGVAIEVMMFADVSSIMCTF